ncbi:MAG: sugar phosphate isomerase/epimerase [Anaerolineae bacterium]|nr:sugar phosphate isomerase/epimerase [Anaerolineae bacterium]
MAHGVILDIGINGAFLTRRWEEPENWMRVTAELGYPYHEFCSDVLDPFFSGDSVYQQETAAAVAEAAKRHGVCIWDIYTGVATHRFHGLSHRHPAVRERMAQWIRETMALARAMGAERIGGHWDAISVEELEDDAGSDAVERRTIEQFRSLAEEAKPLGITAIYNEQMYIPSERPWTIAGAKRFLEAANRGRRGVPIYLTVDVGHQAGMHYGLTGEDLDYRAWLRELAPFCEVVHLQQTTPDGSHHWPFTEEYNQRGHIRMDEVLQAISDGFARASESPLAAALPPVRKQILVAEIIPGSTKHEAPLLRELEASAAFLRRYIPEGGLRI